MSLLLGAYYMFHIALFEPEIPPNTGNIIRLCANTGTQLHLIHPLGFAMETKALRRAGLDYAEWAEVKQYENYQVFLKENDFGKIHALTTKAKNYYHQVCYQPNDCLLLGPETRGLPCTILDSGDCHHIRIPMQRGSRSLNLSNTAAVVLYQALASAGFRGLC